MANRDIEVGSELEAAAHAFFNAAYEYREYIKRNHPEKLAGVLWVNNVGGECVMYSENPKYSEQIKRLTWTGFPTDEFTIQEEPYEG